MTTNEYYCTKCDIPLKNLDATMDHLMHYHPEDYQEATNKVLDFFDND